MKRGQRSRAVRACVGRACVVENVRGRAMVAWETGGHRASTGDVYGIGGVHGGAYMRDIFFNVQRAQRRDLGVWRKEKVHPYRRAISIYRTGGMAGNG